MIINQDIPLEGWNTLLKESKHSTPFQTPEFFELINEIPGLAANAFAVESGGVLSALGVTVEFADGGIKGYFSRRCIIYGGPLILPGCGNALDSLLEIISQRISSSVIYIETRNYSDYGPYKAVFDRHGWRYVPYLDIRIATGDREAMVSAISSSRRRQIRKAVSNGAEIMEPCSVADVKAFYVILKEHYKKKVRKPLLPWDFFSKAYQLNYGKFFLIRYAGSVIGGIYCPLLEGRSIYEFYVCGLDHEYGDLYPSVMATWAAMDYAGRNGIAFFDLMGAGRVDEDYGVRDFKARFGGIQEEYGRFLRINNKILYNIGKTGLKIMGKLIANENSD